MPACPQEKARSYTVAIPKLSEVIGSKGEGYGDPSGGPDGRGSTGVRPAPPQGQKQAMHVTLNIIQYLLNMAESAECNGIVADKVALFPCVFHHICRWCCQLYMLVEQVVRAGQSREVQQFLYSYCYHASSSKRIEHTPRVALLRCSLVFAEYDRSSHRRRGRRACVNHDGGRGVACGEH